MTDASTADRRPWDVFCIFLCLGLTSFGGPIAHLAYFRDEFVTRRGWLTERSYADLVALCQFLPGPASSQVGLALGLSRAGYAGAFAAWAGFTDLEVGRLTRGRHADFVVLGADPLKAPPGKLATIPVLSTWVDGSPVYQQ